MSFKQLQDIDFGGVSRLTNLPAPASDNDAARLADLNSAVEGLAWKDSARVATQTNINLASPGATIDGVTMASTDRFLARAQTAPAENGIYIWNGAASAATRSLDASTAPELEQAVVTVEEGTSAGVTYRQTAVNFTLGTSAVTWAVFGTSAPAASETTAGIAEIATQAEVNAGSDDLRIVTPAKLAAYTGAKLKYVTTVGDGSATQYVVTHNLGTRDLHIQVYRTATPWDTVGVDIERTSTTTATIRFGSAPASGAYTVVCLG